MSLCKSCKKSCKQPARAEVVRCPWYEEEEADND